MEFIRANLYSLVAMAALLLLSATFSGSEAALFSLRETDLHRIRRLGGLRSRAILALHRMLPQFLTTILLANLVVNVLFFAMGTILGNRLAENYGQAAAVVWGLGLLMTVLTFGEITPKIAATAAKIAVSRLVAVPLWGLCRLCRWLHPFLDAVARVALRMANIKPPPPTVRAEELKLLLQASSAEGTITAQERDFICQVIELPEIRMREIMVPRIDCITVAFDADAKEALRLSRQHGHAKLPVRDPKTDDWLGWVDARELFVAGAEGPVALYLKRAIFVSEFDRADQALRLFQETGARLAIVLDERGAAAGLITLADLLAAIFGDYAAPDEAAEPSVREEGPNTYILSGDLRIAEWRALFGVVRELPQVATLGGLVTALLGRLPRTGDGVCLGNISLEVLAMEHRRVRKIRLTLREEEEKANHPC
ncbi:MAG: hemolysin family protein [Planctomycetota bacterium]|nr:hemolysin family protein [Planctomycetota bacterium]